MFILKRGSAKTQRCKEAEAQFKIFFKSIMMQWQMVTFHSNASNSQGVFVNTRRQNSASKSGSKVQGTMTY